MSERRILKSWKEIASYLGVGIRTAQRWRQLCGLPVRQPGVSKKSAVLSMSDEIDQWLLASASRREPVEGQCSILNEIVVTDVLWNRPSRPRQPEREVDVLLELGCLMAHQEQHAVLAKIAANALTLCKAESAGFSILETAADGSEIFRWTGTCGAMQSFEGGTTPAKFSPCGYCLEHNSPQLFRHPERFYSYLAPISPIAELLLIPMHDDSTWVGTIWIMSRQGRRKFDREDARLMMQLGSLATETVVAARRAGIRTTAARPLASVANG